MSAGVTSDIARGLQIVLGMVFLTAAVAKMRNVSGFAAAISGYQLTPAVISGHLAAVLMVVESLIGISMLSGWWLDVAVLTACGLLLGFAMAVGINLRRGRAIPCGCFGSDTERISVRTLARLGLLMLAAVALAASRIVFNLPPLDWANLATDGMGGFQQLVVPGAFSAWLSIAAMWILHMPEIATLFHRRPLNREEKRA